MNQQASTPQMMSEAELHTAIASSAAVIKLVCGVGNNAAWLVMCTAMDHVRQCRRYTASVRGGSVKSLFKRAFNELHTAERNMLRASTNRMFRLDDLPPEVRKRYGDIRDDDYFEFWKSIGGPAYTHSMPFITSLWNKYRVSLEHHGVADAQHVAWAMTAQAALMLADSMYNAALRQCQNEHHLSMSVLKEVFGQFSLRRIIAAWYKALSALAPETKHFDLDDTENRNIEHGILQLAEAWSSPQLLYSSTSETVRDMSDLFATRGYQKKILKELDGLESITRAQLK